MKAKSPVILFITVLTVIFISALSAFYAYAAEETTLTVETSRIAVAGKEFTISVSISDNPGFAVGSYSLSYRKADLTLVGVELGDIAKDAGAELIKPSKYSEYPYEFSISSPVDIASNGELLKFTFKTGKDFGIGEYNVKLSLAGKGMRSSDGGAVNAKTVEGGFSITCLHKYADTVIKPRCDAKGYTYHRCTECSASYMDTYVDELPHTWRTVSASDPTCTEDGVLERYCTVCSFRERVKNGDALGHDYDGGREVASTCQRQGYTVYTCKRCNASYRENFQPLAPHDYEETVIKEPTCQEVGYRHLVCKECGDSRTEEMQAVDHDYVFIETHPATHEEKGWDAYQCRFCGVAMRDHYVDPVPYDMRYTVVDPTCTEPGEKIGVCADGCGKTTREVIPALGHAYGDWITETEPGETSEGLEYRVCERCGDREEQSIPALGVTKNTEDDKRVSWTDLRQIIVVSAGSIVVLFVIMLFIIIGSHKRRKEKNV